MNFRDILKKEKESTRVAPRHTVTRLGGQQAPSYLGGWGLLPDIGY